MDAQLRQSLTSRQPWFWIPTVTFLAAIVVGLFLLATLSDIPFDSAKWKIEEEVRPLMVRDLLDNHKLRGLSRDSIDKLLGTPTGRDSIHDGNYIYWAGSDGVIDDMRLEINFDGDVVASRSFGPD